MAALSYDLERHKTAFVAFLRFMNTNSQPQEIDLKPETYKFGLQDIYDEELETRIKQVHTRDYLNFGFSNWSP